tara:strand:+ start:76 stop:744 length:669 start_codon:yes stop_codon:yes gene_type:complete
MSIKSTMKFLKWVNLNSNLPIINKASLSISGREIEFEANGVPSSIIIEYDGIVNFQRTLPFVIKTLVGKNTILINNFYKQFIPKKLISYNGNLIVKKCVIMNFDGSTLNCEINNIGQSLKFERSNTKWEDDTTMLFEEKEVSQHRIRRGYNNPTIGVNYSAQKPLSDKEQIKESVVKIAEQIAKPVTEDDISQDIPRHTIADKIRESMYEEGEKARKDKEGY